MEIVSQPDMRSPAEAGAYLSKLRTILRYVGSCDGNMDQGSMRADVNVSVRKPGEPFGTRTETKNVNSVRFVMAVVEHEANRQVDVLEAGGKVVQETRLYDPDRNETRSMRSKEDAHDYRYFPDPDLLPLELDDAFLEECRQSLPELPDAKRRRYEKDLGLRAYNAGSARRSRRNRGGRGGRSRSRHRRLARALRGARCRAARSCRADAVGCARDARGADARPEE